MVHDRLPACLLELDGIGAFRVERFNDLRLIPLFDESNIHSSSVFHGVADRLMPLHDIVDAAKIKAHAPILRFHPCQKLAADPQIVFGSRRMPVFGRLIPLRDVIRLGPTTPYLLYRGLNNGLHGYFRRLTRFQFKTPLS